MIASFLKKIASKFFGQGVTDHLGASRKEIDDLYDHESFSDYLPWLYCDQEEETYHCTDDGQGFIWECSPINFSTEKTLQMSEAILRLPLPVHSVIQFILHADPNIKPVVRGFKHLRRKSSKVSQTAADRYVAYLRKCTLGAARNGGIPLRSFRLFVAIKLPPGNTLSKDQKEKINRETTEILKSIGVWPQFMDPHSFSEWVRRLMNEKVPEQIRPDGQETAGLINEMRSLSKQVLFAGNDVNIEDDHMKIGNKHWVCMTPKTFPMEVDPLETSGLFGGVWGLRSDGSQITTPFIYALNIVIDSLKNPIRSKCDLLLMQGAVGSFARSLQRKQEESVWAVDKVEHDVFARAMPIMWFYDTDLIKVREARSRAKTVWEGSGYIIQEDKDMLAAMWLSMMPLGFRVTKNNLTMFERDFITPSDAIMNILPIQGDFSGSNEPVYLLQGRKGQIIPFSIFTKKADNYNGFIAAASGKGKSFLMNFLCFNGRATGVKLRVVDLGGSYEKLCSMDGGRYIDFADSHNQNLCMNPFTNVNENELDEDLLAISYIVMQMIYAAVDDIRPPKEEYMLAKEACQWAWNTHGRDASTDEVFQYLSEYPKYTDRGHTEEIISMAHHMAFTMYDYTSNGSYGSYFVGRSNFDIKNDDFVVLELDALRNIKDLFKVITLLVLDAAQRDLYLSDRSEPRQVIFDEAWQFLGGGNKLMLDIIESGYRRARKYHGSFFVITQSLLDRQKFGDIGNIIWSQADFKFLLESGDFKAAKDAGLIDYSDFTMELLKSVKTNAPAYSEVFCDTPFGRGVGRLSVDDYSYFVYTSHPAENAEMLALAREGVPWPDIINFMVQKYRKPDPVMQEAA